MVHCHIYLHGGSLQEEDIRVIFGNFDSEMARKVFCAVSVGGTNGNINIIHAYIHCTYK